MRMLFSLSTLIQCLPKQVHLYIRHRKCIKDLDIRILVVKFNIKFSESVDMWGVGTIIYTILIGEVPFNE
jgi:hypothetical protein